MKNKAIIHTKTDFQLQSYLDTPSHALFLYGPSGLGKLFIAKHLAAELLGVDFEHIETHPYFKIISPADNLISIDDIRNLKKFMNLKTIGTDTIRRVVIIDNSDAMGLEAQNTLLKLLEEPPLDTVLILTGQNLQALLPTVLSRVQVVNIHPPEKQKIIDYFESSYSSADVNKYYFLSGGLPGLMQALLDSNQGHPLVEAVNSAKAFLTQSIPERLLSIDSLSKHKDQAIDMLYALVRMANTGIQQATISKDKAKLEQWYSVLNSSYAAHSALEVNANLKLVLLNLALNI